MDFCDLPVYLWLSVNDCECVMSGCYGNSGIDRWLQGLADEHHGVYDDYPDEKELDFDPEEEEE